MFNSELLVITRSENLWPIAESDRRLIRHPFEPGFGYRLPSTGRGCLEKTTWLKKKLHGDEKQDLTQAMDVILR